MWVMVPSPVDSSSFWDLLHSRSQAAGHPTEGITSIQLWCYCLWCTTHTFDLLYRKWQNIWKQMVLEYKYYCVVTASFRWTFDEPPVLWILGGQTDHLLRYSRHQGGGLKVKRQGGVVRTNTCSQLSPVRFNPSIHLAFILPCCWQPVATSLTPTQMTWTFYHLLWVDTVKGRPHERRWNVEVDKHNCREMTMEVIKH